MMHLQNVKHLSEITFGADLNSFKMAHFLYIKHTQTSMLLFRRVKPHTHYVAMSSSGHHIIKHV